MSIVVDARQFLEKFLPVPDEVIAEIHKSLEEESLYKDSKWIGFPNKSNKNNTPSILEDPRPVATSSTQDESSHKAFVRIANRITHMLYARSDSAQVRLSGEWVDTHDRTPLPHSPRSQIILPDISFATLTTAREMKTWPQAPKDETEKSDNATEQIQVDSCEEAKVNTTEDNQTDGGKGEDTEQTALDKEASRLWLQIFTVVEVKLNENARSLTRLSTYVGQIFREQLDRQFVFALSLHFDNIQVHLFDRSGAVSSTAMDIHKQPKEFIRIISSFSYLPPPTLGWDPTFRVWDGNDVVPSYTTSLQKFNSAYEVPWVIDGFGENQANTISPGGSPARNTEIPIPENNPCTSFAIVAESNDPSCNEDAPPAKDYWQYVVIRILCLENEKRIWGRGTIVLEAISLEDWRKKNEKAQIYVMKQSWQRLPICDNDDGTVELFNAKQGPDKPMEPSVDIQSLHTEIQSYPFEACVLRHAGMADRLHDYGYVRSNKEKVETLSFIRQELKYMPLKAGNDLMVKLNTDTNHWSSEQPPEESISQSVSETELPVIISRTQSRIFWKLSGWPIRRFKDKRELLRCFKNAVKDHERLYKAGIVHRDISINNILISPSGEGHLIDFDHSKITVRTKKPSSASGSLEKDWREIFSRYLDQKILELAEQWYGSGAVPYLAELHKTWNFYGSSTVTTADLGWIDEPYPIPDFGDHKPGDTCAGTPPFMSWKLRRDFSGHKAIHDIESFWWVLIYIMLKCDGPGGTLRKNPSKELKQLVDDLFYNDYHSARAKGRILGRGDSALENLFKHVSPYFDNLKDLVRRWYSVFQIAWMHDSGMEDQYPHSVICKILDTTLAQLDGDGEATERDDLTKAEETRREIYQRDAEMAIRRQMTVHGVSREQTSDKAASSTTPIPDPVEKCSAMVVTPVQPTELKAPFCSPEEEPPRKKLRRCL